MAWIDPAWIIAHPEEPPESLVSTLQGRESVLARAWRRTRATRFVREFKIPMGREYLVVRRRERGEAGRKTINMLIVRTCQKHQTEKSKRLEVVGQLFDDGTCSLQPLKLPGECGLSFLSTGDNQARVDRPVVDLPKPQSP